MDSSSLLSQLRSLSRGKQLLIGSLVCLVIVSLIVGAIVVVDEFSGGGGDDHDNSNSHGNSNSNSNSNAPDRLHYLFMNIGVDGYGISQTRVDNVGTKATHATNYIALIDKATLKHDFDLSQYSVAPDCANELVYYVATTDGTNLYSVPFNGTAKPKVVASAKGGSDSCAAAFDSSNSSVYVACWLLRDSKSYIYRVNVVTEMTEMVEVVVDNSIEKREIIGMQIDSINQIIFMLFNNELIASVPTEGGQLTVVYDGSDQRERRREVQKKSNIQTIALDPNTKKVYWTDYDSNHIATVHYDGTDAKKVYDQSTAAIAFDPVDATLYYGVDSIGKQEVWMVNTTTWKDPVQVASYDKAVHFESVIGNLNICN